MSVETFATEARNPFYLNYIGITDRTCLSCGHVIGAESEAPGANQDWLKYYRALYHTSNGARLSDVVFANLDWRVMQRDCGNLGSSERAALRERFGPWYQMSCSSPSQAHIFHESCWIILSRQLEEDPDLDKLFQVCKDIPPSGRIPWYEPFGVQRDAQHTYPLKRPIVRDLLAKNRSKLPQIQIEVEQDYLFSENDCFRILPLELRTLVASNLSTSEFFSLRQVSRSMAEVFEDRLFQDANRIFVISQEPHQLATSSILQALNNSTRSILSLGLYILAHHAGAAHGKGGFASFRGRSRRIEKLAIEP